MDHVRPQEGVEKKEVLKVWNVVWQPGGLELTSGRGPGLGPPLLCASAVPVIPGKRVGMPVNVCASSR